jgi:hypothetical protein
MTFQLPPLVENAQGETRRAGFELEFAGVSLEAISEHVQAVFGGHQHRCSAFHHEVRDTVFGTFGIEVDAAMLKNQSWRTWLKSLGLDPDDLPLIDNLDSLEDQLARWAGKLVPYEVVTPPIPVDSLAPLDELRQRLHDDMAQGTRASVVNAFGLHINPEAPALEADSLRRHLQAFLLLNPLIQEASNIDFSRKLTPYIKRFPERYARLLLRRDYQPDLQQFARDYLAHNPTRNRPLDMLPLLIHCLGEDWLPLCEEPDLVKPRPAYHYRLPNCLLDEDDWRIAEEWNRWLVVERLAADQATLDSLLGRRGQA